MRPRLVPLALALLAALALGAGCGGGGSSSSSDVAGLAPPNTLVFAEGTLRPTGALKTNADRVAATIGGIDNLGEFIVEKLEEESRQEGEPFDYESEVAPWLGERAGAAFDRLEEDGDLGDPVIVAETTDAAATQDFIDHRAQISNKPYRDESYEGVDFKVGGEDGEAVGVVDDFLVIGKPPEFKAAVDASSGDSLADEDRYKSAVEGATEGSLTDVYVDVGGLIEESGDEIDPQARQLLQGAGIDPSEATALASVVPGSDQIEINLSSDLAGEEAPSGDASELLGSLPAESFAAFAVSGFGEQLQEALDSLDKSGIPGQIPPNQLKSGLKEAGIDLDQIASSLGDAGVFATGRGERSLGGALVLTTDDSKQASNTVSNIGLLLRASQTPGVTAVNGEASGFSVRSEELGPQPLVVVAKDKRIAIGYGLAPTLRGIGSSGGAALSSTPAYKEATAALGDTPISAFVAGPAALSLAEALVPPSESGFREAKPYLRKIASVALGSSSEGDLATAKLIVSLTK